MKSTGPENQDGGVPPRAPFYASLARSLARRGMSVGEVCRLEDAVERRVLEEYGAMFLAAAAVRVPPRCVFRDAEEVEQFQREATFRAEDFGGVTVELQPAALEALVAARAELRSAGVDLSPRGGAEAARRTYADTLRLWDSRFFPALTYWCVRGRLSVEEASRLCALGAREQVSEVLRLERGGVFFSKDFSKTVLQSVAAPGASPHLSMYAFDAAEFREPRVRAALARHGWFQTVAGDLPHFTFLGLPEGELPARGLRRAEASGQVFWIPDMGDGGEGLGDGQKNFQVVEILSTR